MRSVKNPILILQYQLNFDFPTHFYYDNLIGKRYY
jgi:hypothetical protein